MKLIRGLHNIRLAHANCVATIGNFDGVHLGHQQVLTNLIETAKVKDLPAVVIIFEPQPQEYFAKTQAPARLTRLQEKIKWMSQHAVDTLLCIKFNHSLAQLSAEAFIEQVLVQHLGIRHLVVGDDFRFGRGRVGDFNMLQQFGLQYGYTVSNTHSFYQQGLRVSSTAIRTLLQQHQLQQAAALLGRPYSIMGRVIHGDKKGRTIGFPTANIDLHRLNSPVNGVFAVQVTMEKTGQRYPGIANIGKRPTMQGQNARLEVHVFDFDSNLYGQRLNVELVDFIRDEMKFASFEQLRQQIVMDCQLARQKLALD